MDDELIKESLGAAISEQRLEDLGVDYIDEGIESQLEDPFDIQSAKNYLKKLENIKFDDEDSANDYKDIIYNKIVDRISGFFDFDVDKEDDVSMKKIAKTFYKFFILELKTNIIYFLEMYIIDHKKEIYAALSENENINTRRIEGMSSQMSHIFNNMSEVIDYIRDCNLDFSDFLHYENEHTEVGASVNEMIDFTNSCLDRTENIYNKIINYLADEHEGFSDIYTALMMNLYKRFGND